MNKVKKALLVFQSSRGGAGIAAIRMAEAFDNASSSWSVDIYSFDDLMHVKKISWVAIAKRVVNALVLGRNSRFRLSFKFFGVSFEKVPKLYDLIIIHSISELPWAFENLEKFLRSSIHSRGKILFHLHDEWLLTGGCFYSFECGGKFKGCIDCPLVKVTGLKAFPRNSHQLKRNLLENLGVDISITAPSEWLVAKARAVYPKVPSSILRNPVLSKDLSWSDHAISEVAVGLIDEWRQNGFKIFAFGADSFDDPWKGSQQFWRGLKGLQDARVRFLLFGSGSLHLVGREYFGLGFLDRDQMNALISQVDCYLHLALVENFSNTIVECLHIGTPVIASSVGGNPEFFENAPFNGVCLNSEKWANYVNSKLFKFWIEGEGSKEANQIKKRQLFIAEMVNSQIFVDQIEKLYAS